MFRDHRMFRDHTLLMGISHCSRAAIDRQDQDHCATAMSPDRPLCAPLTDSLRSDIVLLTSYLSGKQCLGKSPPMDEHLALSMHISTLLAIGNNHGQYTQNGTAVLGNHTTMGTEFVVFGENNDESVTTNVRTTPRERKVQSGEFYNGASDLQQNADPDHKVEGAGEIISISSNMENGRHLLDKWDPQLRNDQRVDLLV